MKLEQLTENVIITNVNDDANKYYTNVCRHLIKELKIHMGTKIVVHADSRHLSADSNHNGSTLPDFKNKDTIHVYLRPEMDRATLLRALCHEFVHVEQIASGRLVLDIENKKLVGMEWEGNPVKNPNYDRNSEWELEAHIKEQKLLHSVVGSVGNLM